MAVKYSESCRHLTVDCAKDQMTSYLKRLPCPLLSKATVLSMVACVGLDQHVKKTLHFLLFLSKRLIHTPRFPFPLYFTACICAGSSNSLLCIHILSLSASLFSLSHPRRAKNVLPSLLGIPPNNYWDLGHDPVLAL